MEMELLVKQYVKAEKELEDALSELPGAGGECHCPLDNRAIVRTIFEGEFPEITTWCVNCGGALGEY